MGDDAADDVSPAPGATPSGGAFRVEHGAQVVVHVSGELDALTGTELGTLLSEAFGSSARSVAVDLRELAFIDSVGLSVMVTAHNLGATDGVPFEVHNVPPSCMRVLEITRLVDVLDLR